MNCLILAAGLGSRLRGISDSKPLTPVAGAPLLEHVIRRSLFATEIQRVLGPGGRAFVFVPDDCLGPIDEPEHVIKYTNWGNTPVRLRLKATDPDEKLGFFLRPDEIELPLRGNDIGPPPQQVCAAGMSTWTPVAAHRRTTASRSGAS